jgi:hypothetical protein
MSVIWAVLAILVLLAGLRYRQRLQDTHEDGGPSTIDDDAIDRIIRDGTLATNDELDLDAAAEAEDEFWSEYWDEPDEYQP